MKVVLLAVPILTACLGSMAGAVEPSQIRSVDRGEWGAWTSSDSYKGIDFRVRCEEYNSEAKKYKWSVQFRNSYQKQLHLSCRLATKAQTDVNTTDRLHISSGGTDSTWFLLAAKPGEQVRVLFDSVRVGEDSGPYYPPDKK